MNLKTIIEEAARRALKNQEKVMLSTLRMLLSAIHNREIEKKSKTGTGELNQEEVTGVLRSEVKKRRDAMAEFQKADRGDLAEKESAEAAILEAYLPPELADSEIESVVREVIASIGPVAQKDMGRVMGEAMKRVKGRASGERVKELVEKFLPAS